MRDDLTGRWITKATRQSPDTELLSFAYCNGAWTGTMTTRFGSADLRDIVLNGDAVAFSQTLDLGIGPVAPVRFQGTLVCDELRFRTIGFTGWGYVDRVAHRLKGEPLAAIEHVSRTPQRFEPLPYDGLAATPPMGWNSWNRFALTVNDSIVREIADALVATGLRDVGYVYVNIDDGWQGTRDAMGVLHSNAKFPDMRALADYVHSLGLRLGIYSSPGTQTCGLHVGSYGYEEIDAATWASWGIDYLKYDWCSADQVYFTPAEMQGAFHRMGAALRAAGRPVIYALCQYGLFEVGHWGRRVGAHLWRTTTDISDSWQSVERNALAQIGREGQAGPGGWNDPDMLEVGNRGLTFEECRTHLTLWSMLSAPLMLGNDPRSMTPELAALLSNPEVIGVDQDPLGIPARPHMRANGVWTKPLADGSLAIAITNPEASPASRTVDWSDLDLVQIGRIRDLWLGVDLEPESRARFTLPPHGSVLLRAWSEHSLARVGNR